VLILDTIYVKNTYFSIFPPIYIFFDKNIKKNPIPIDFFFYFDTIEQNQTYKGDKT